MTKEEMLDKAQELKNKGEIGEANKLMRQVEDMAKSQANLNFCHVYYLHCFL